MHRRGFLSALVCLAGAPAAFAQTRLKLGVLGDRPGAQWHLFRQTLAQLGHVEGKNLILEQRWAEGQVKRFPGLAAELVAQKVDMLVVEGTPAARAAKAATDSIPVVMAIVGEPVGTGLIRSLTRPGGNLTGMTSGSAELHAKQMELLRVLLPAVSRLGVLWHPDNATSRLALKEIEQAGERLKVRLEFAEARGPRDLDGAFAVLEVRKCEAVLIVPEPTFDAVQPDLARLATSRRLPGVYNKSAFAESGGLLAYGARHSDFFRRAAHYVDRIAKGARPADLPVEGPSVFDLVINARTAKDLGIVIPTPLLLRANQVIQ